MLNSAIDLKDLGFNATLFEKLDDTTPDGNGKTALDRFLETCLMDAGFLIENWISTKYLEAHTNLSIQPRIKRAELLLAQLNCMDYLQTSGSTQVEELEIEGIKVNPKVEKDVFKSLEERLMDKAKELLYPYHWRGPILV